MMRKACEVCPYLMVFDGDSQQEGVVAKDSKSLGNLPTLTVEVPIHQRRPGGGCLSEYFGRRRLVSIKRLTHCARESRSSDALGMLEVSAEPGIFKHLTECDVASKPQ